MNDSKTFVLKKSLHTLLQACLREKILKWVGHESGCMIPLTHSKQSIQIKKIKKYSLGRYEFLSDVLLFNEDNHSSRVIEYPLEFLRILKEECLGEFEAKRWEAFQAEIKNHLDNSILNLEYQDIYRKRIKAIVSNSHHSFLTQWALENEKNPDIFFEQLVILGHPIHPCSKTKMGFTPEEVKKYSPEFHPTLALTFSAIHKKQIHIENSSSDLNYIQWFQKTFSEISEKINDALIRRNINPTDYIPIPLHPWQVENIILEKFNNLIKENILIILPEITLMTTLTSSFRTCMPIHHSHAPHIKLPVAIQSTSAIRTVSAASAENSPKISAMISKILSMENHFNGRLRSLSEFFGLHIMHCPVDDQRHYSVIYRENPKQHLHENELAITLAALFEPSPITDAPIFVELLLMNQINGIEKAKKFFKHYTQIVLNAYLDLYVIYGIALEGHQQNTLVILKNGLPIAMMNRDYGGVRMHANSLIEKGFDFIAHPNSATICEKRMDARNKLLHTVYQSHLGQWCQSLAIYFNCEESIFWEIVRELTIQRLMQLKTRVAPTHWQADWNGILENDWPLKALMRMRLCDQSHEYIHVTCDNPLKKN